MDKEARESKTGLWGACPAGTGATATRSMPIKNTSGGSCVIKGNISSSGEKIYHLLGCGSYTKTQIDEARGERWFCSESEAQAAGWRRALNCN
jgi:micrococcal nuclease